MHELCTPAQTLALLTTINVGIQELLDSPDDRAEALHALNNGLLSKVSPVHASSWKSPSSDTSN
jgi:hypothetical protein